MKRQPPPSGTFPSFDVDVQQVTGCIVLVAADRLAGRPVHLAQPADPAAAQDRVHQGLLADVEEHYLAS